MLRFYERRIRRIFPALFAMLLATSLAAWFYLNPDSITSYFRMQTSVLLFYSNLYLQKKAGYFDNQSELNPLLHTWSLSVEEQFYVLFPILLWLFRKRGLRPLVLSLFVLSLVICQARVWTGSIRFFETAGRSWELLLGAFVALLPELKHAIETRQQKWLAALGLLMIPASMYLFSRATPMPSLYGIFPTMGTALLLRYASADNWTGRFLAWPPLVSVGLVSYSAYLWHQPILAFARLLSVDPIHPSHLALLSLASLPIAYFSWRWIETPLRQSKCSRKMVYTLAGVTTSMFLGLSLVAAHNSDLQSKHMADQYHLELRPQAFSDEHLVDRCFLQSEDTFANAFSFHHCVRDGQRKVALIGDSHAASLYPALKKYLEARGFSLSMLTAAGCIPLIENFPTRATLVTTARCEKINQEVAAIIQRENFAVVLFGSFFYEWGARGDPQWSYSGYFADLKESLRRHLKYGTKLVVIGPFPIWSRSLPDILYLDVRMQMGSPAARSSYGLVKESVAINTKIADIAADVGAPYLSVTDFLCTQEGCLRMVPNGGRSSAISFDYGHFSEAGADYLVEKYLGDQVVSILNSSP